MSTKYFILSFLLLFIIFLLFLKNYELWTAPLEEAAEKEIVKKTEKKPEILLMAASQKNPASLQSQLFISEKNIFSPERKDFPILGGNAKKPLVRPQIVLYGVTIAGDYQVASIVNPGRPLTKGERESMTVKVGDQVGEYKLVKILSDRITMEAEGDSFEVLLYDPRAPKKRVEVKTETKPATVISSQPAPSAPIPKTTTPTPPSTSAEAAKPSPSPQVVTPQPPAQTPVRPYTPAQDIRRRRPVFPPSGAPAQGTGGSQ